MSGPAILAKASTLNKGIRLLHSLIRILEYFVYILSGSLNLISFILCLGNFIQGTSNNVPFLVIYMYTYGLLLLICLMQGKLVKILSNGDKFVNLDWDVEKIRNRKLEKTD